MNLHISVISRHRGYESNRSVPKRPKISSFNTLKYVCMYVIKKTLALVSYMYTINEHSTSIVLYIKLLKISHMWKMLTKLFLWHFNNV